MLPPDTLVDSRMKYNLAEGMVLKIAVHAGTFFSPHTIKSCKHPKEAQVEACRVVTTHPGVLFCLQASNHVDDAVCSRS